MSFAFFVCDLFVLQTCLTSGHHDISHQDLHEAQTISQNLKAPESKAKSAGWEFPLLFLFFFFTHRCSFTVVCVVSITPSSCYSVRVNE